MNRITLTENRRRLNSYFYDYNPAVGDAYQMCIPRQKIKVFGVTLWLPKEFINTERKLFAIIDKVKPTAENINNFTRLRIKYDFEFFCVSCCKIRHKTLGKIIPLKPNFGQRKIIRDLEEMRLAGEPIDMVLVKSRQYGGSTIIEHYIAWIILFHKENWDTFVVGKDTDQSANIRRMLEDIVNNIPQQLGKFSISVFAGMKNTKFIPQRNCRISVGSAQSPDKLRSYSGFAMHLSECSSWISGKKISADFLAQSLWSIVPNVPYSIRILESTAKGVGNFFHKEFIAASQNDNKRKATFVSWFEIDIYNEIVLDGDGNIVRNKSGSPISKIKDPEKFISTLSDYEKWQWQQGATLEGIKWYRHMKRTGNFSDFQMKSEYPCTAIEAFQAYANSVFEPFLRQTARQTCREPAFTGEIYADAATGENALKNIHFSTNSNGLLNIWTLPETDSLKKILNRYIVVVDIGGLSAKSDWSVITVFDRQTVADPFGALEHIATWRGHIDHDLLAWKAMQIAAAYDFALLVIESNTLETRDRKTEKTYEGNHYYTVINEIAGVYPNVYMRTADKPEDVNMSKTFKYGFHTNKLTKYAAYDAARIALRNYRYIEYDHYAVDEMETVQYAENGKIEAAPQYHDDVIDTIAIAVYISEKQMDAPIEISRHEPVTVNIDPETGMAF
jgi:hypothetical protein